MATSDEHTPDGGETGQRHWQVACTERAAFVSRRLSPPANLFGLSQPSGLSMNAVLSDPLASPAERVVQALLQRGKLKEADLGRARRLQGQDGGGLLRLLAKLGLVSERDHAAVCAAEFDLPLRSARDVPELPPEDAALGAKFMKQFHVVAVAADATRVEVLLADPQDPYVLGAVAPP